MNRLKYWIAKAMRRHILAILWQDPELQNLACDFRKAEADIARLQERVKSLSEL